MLNNGWGMIGQNGVWDKGKDGIQLLGRVNRKVQNKYKVKVKVIQKARPHQSPGKKKIQRLLLEDDKGNTMRGTIFDMDIPSFEQAIVRNGEYEIEDALIQKVPDEVNKDGNPYQMNFNPNIKLIPISSDPDVGKPHYIMFSEIPRTQVPKQDLIDIVGVVLFIEKTRDISIGPTTQRVRELVFTDSSVSSPRTLVLSAWNDFTDNDIQAITNMDSSLPIIGVTPLRTTVHKGFSVASTVSSTIIAEPIGDHADTLRKWATDNGASLVQLQNQVLQARSETEEHSITPIVTLKAKKAINTLHEEKHWIKVYVPNAASDDLFVYIGCSNCGRKGDAIVGETYKCMQYNEHEAKVSHALHSRSMSSTPPVSFISPSSPKKLNRFFSKAWRPSTACTLLMISLFSTMLLITSVLLNFSCKSAQKLLLTEAISWHG